MANQGKKIEILDNDNNLLYPMTAANCVRIGDTGSLVGDIIEEIIFEADALTADFNDIKYEVSEARNSKTVRYPDLKTRLDNMEDRIGAGGGAGGGGAGGGGASTVDQEVANARTDSDGTLHANLSDRLNDDYTTLNAKFGNYLPLSGGTVTGTINFDDTNINGSYTSNHDINAQEGDGKSAIKLNNGTVVGLQQLIFNDASDTIGEGIAFPKSEVRAANNTSNTTSGSKFGYDYNFIRALDGLIYIDNYTAQMSRTISFNKTPNVGSQYIRLGSIKLTGAIGTDTPSGNFLMDIANCEDINSVHGAKIICSADYSNNTAFGKVTILYKHGAFITTDSFVSYIEDNSSATNVDVTISFYMTNVNLLNKANETYTVSYNGYGKEGSNTRHIFDENVVRLDTTPTGVLGSPTEEIPSGSFLPLTGGTMTGGITFPNSTAGQIKHTTADGIVTNTLYITAGTPNLRVGNETVINKVDLRGKANPTATVGANTHTLYHTGYKPTAQDVGALPINGGTMTGQLAMNNHAIRLSATGDNPRIGYSTSDACTYIANGSNNWFRINDDKTLTFAGNLIPTFNGGAGSIQHSQIRYGANLNGQAGFITFTW